MGAAHEVTYRLPVVISSDGIIVIGSKADMSAYEAMRTHPQAGDRLLAAHWLTFTLPLPGGGLEVTAEVSRSCALREVNPLHLRPPTELPELSDEDYGAWQNTVDVLGFTATGRALVAYAQVWRDEGGLDCDDRVKWKIAGRDSYNFDDMVGWRPLPTSLQPEDHDGR